MVLASLQTGIWLIPWPWVWIMIGLAVGFTLLLGWSWLVLAKQGDKNLEVYNRELQRKISDRSEQNGKGR